MTLIIFSSGDGNDVIEDTGGTDRLVLDGLPRSRFAGRTAGS